ncbi:MAG: Fe-S cluster assembly protein SufD [Bdellovibrionota bacterium]
MMGEQSHFVSSVSAVHTMLQSDTSPIASLRRKAFEKFLELGIPTSKNEDWKYTSLQSLSRTSFVLAGTPERAITRDQIAAYFLEGASRLVFVNGRFAEELSSAEIIGSSKSVVIETLANLVQPNPQDTESAALLAEKMGSVASIESHPFVALNTALAADGAFIRLRAGTALERPIQLVFVTSDDQEGVTIPLRNTILCEKAAQGRIVETFIGSGENRYLTSHVTEIICEQDAKLDHTRTQLESQQAHHISNLHVRLAQRSNFSSHVFSFGAELARNEIHPVLDGEHIECYLNGLTVIHEDQHIDNSTVIDHAKPNCFSREVYKGIYAGQSRGVFSGTIIVRPDAQKTNAIQSNQTLLLTEDASIDTRPQLKIWADDVKCTHGATVGQLDNNALFYLRSRGISREEARNMLIHAFASDIVSYVQDAALREQLEGWLQTRLEENVVVSN